VAFSLLRFGQVRPYLYHLTSSDNLSRIRSLRRLESAERLLSKAGLPGLLPERRPTHHLITVDGVPVRLRDQTPLFSGNIEYEDGWDFAAVVAHLNRRVFFWPGGESGPIDYGKRHHERYEGEQPAVIRVPTASLLRENRGNPPLFSRFNSGSPRCSGGRKSPRGSRTFLEAKRCDFTASEVVEVTFLNEVVLPDDTVVRRGHWTNWVCLFTPVVSAADAYPRAAEDPGHAI